MSDPANFAKQNLLHVFNERNHLKRRAVMKEIWSTTGILWSSEGTYSGRRAIDSAAAQLLLRYPEYDYQVLDAINDIPCAARMQWAFGCIGSPPALTGEDILTVSGGRIVFMHRFVYAANF